VTAGIRIVTPGLLTTVQDLGRWGFQSFGVSVAGPMDPRAHRIANAQVGNSSSAATLEVTLAGPEIEFEDDRQVAVVGATFDLLLDGRPTSADSTVQVSRGSRLKFGQRRRGARAYLGISGGIAVPQQLGSRATHRLSHVGGHEGRAMVPGDRLPLGEPGVAVHSAPRRGRMPDLTIPHGHATVRVLPGPQQERFVAQALEVLQSVPYRLTSDSDRMGYRLNGPVLARTTDAEMISDATPLGVLQVPPSGQPVLLMADRQTTGGYPKIATVISADIGLAGQLGPGDTIAFIVCTKPQAIAALISQERAFMAVEGAANV
jgi:antagonist of KipI